MSSYLTESDKAFMGIGTPVNKTMTIEHQLKVSGLDWGTYVSPLEFTTEWGDRICEPSVQIISRNDTGEFLVVSGPYWKSYANKDFLTDFNEFCFQAGLEIERVGVATTGKALKKKTVVFASALIPDEKLGVFDVGAGDRSQQRVVYVNPIAYGDGVGAFVLSHRLWCQNQLTLRSHNKKTSSLRHIESHLGRNRIKVSDTLKEIEKHVSNYSRDMRSLVGVKISLDKADDILVQLFGDSEKTLREQSRKVKTMMQIYRGEFDNHPQMQALGLNLAMESETCRRTAFGLLQTVTAYETHFSGANTSAGSRLLEVWDGSDTNSMYNSLALAYIPASQRRSKNKQTQSVKGF